MLPFSYRNKQFRHIESAFLVLPEFDPNEFLERDRVNQKNSDIPIPDQFAEPLDISTYTEGVEWIMLPEEAGQLWRLSLFAKGAESMSLGISIDSVDESAKLWVYNEDGSAVIGPISLLEFVDQKELITPIITGDLMVLEIHSSNSADNLPKPTIHTANLGYDKFLNDGIRVNNSCHVDVVCPAGDNFRDQIRSVCKFSVAGVFRGTGTLINNTKKDGKPYVLTAHHCGITDARAPHTHFYWNVESTKCGRRNIGTSTAFQIGATVKANSDNLDSDFCLLELNKVPEASYNVYYSGWDATVTNPKGVTSIHHPLGEPKSINSYDNTLLSTDYFITKRNSGAMYWMVPEWAIGRNEKKSSGSGLWLNDTGWLIGILSGGESSCSGVKGPDWYCKISSCWDGPNSKERLKDHLDPEGVAKKCKGLQPRYKASGNKVLRDASIINNQQDLSDYADTVMTARMSQSVLQEALRNDTQKTAHRSFSTPAQGLKIEMRNTLILDESSLLEIQETLTLSRSMVNAMTILVSHEQPKTYVLNDKALEIVKKTPDLSTLISNMTEFEL